MNKRILSNEEAPRQASGAPGAQTALAIAEFLMLEECIGRCEALAGAVAERSRNHPMLLQLSDCISACESHLAAKSRESNYQSRHSAFCKEVLTTTAAASRDLDSAYRDLAIRCRMSCEIAIGFLERDKGTLTGLWN